MQLLLLVQLLLLLLLLLQLLLWGLLSDVAAERVEACCALRWAPALLLSSEVPLHTHTCW